MGPDLARMTYHNTAAITLLGPRIRLIGSQVTKNVKVPRSPKLVFGRRLMNQMILTLPHAAASSSIVIPIIGRTVRCFIVLAAAAAITRNVAFAVSGNARKTRRQNPDSPIRTSLTTFIAIVEGWCHQLSRSAATRTSVLAQLDPVGAMKTA